MLPVISAATTFSGRGRRAMPLGSLSKRPKLLAVGLGLLATGSRFFQPRFFPLSLLRF